MTEHARDLYANATAEKIALLQLLKRDQQERQEAEAENRRDFAAHLDVGISLLNHGLISRT